jgi:hypothetical protein
MEPIARAGGSGGGSGGGTGSGSRPGGTPAIGGPAPCLASPVALSGRRLGPFELGMNRSTALLRGGPPGRKRKSALTWCVRGSGRLAVAFQGGRAALLATSTRALTGGRGMRPGKRLARRAARSLGGGLVLVRGRNTSLVASVRRGKVRWTGIVAGHPKPRVIRALAKRTGL